MPLSHRRTNWDYRYVFLVKGVQRGNSGEQILFQRHLHLPVPMPDLGLRFPPTATRTSMSFSVHWQGERETVCVCVCEPVVWPPWDPVRLQHVIYSNSVQHVFCQMGKCVYIWRLVLGRVSCGGWMFWSCCSDCKPLGVGRWEGSRRQNSSKNVFSTSGLLLSCHRHSLLPQSLNKTSTISSDPQNLSNTIYNKYIL